MDRRDVSRRGFVKACGAVAALAAAASGRLARPARALEDAPKLKLVDKAGTPIMASALEVHANYIFLYPYVSTPCLLLRLGAATTRDVERTGRDAAPYVWPGGVGKDGAVVAYSAICAHALSYDSAQTSFLTYSEQRTQLTERERAITCCAHATVYDPANGAEVVSGPAEFPLAAVQLEHDADTDELTAVGLIGTELFDDFFRTYRAELNAEYGRGAYRARLEDRTTVVPIGEYSEAVVQC
jgi:Rieske Fe-S protein